MLTSYKTILLQGHELINKIKDKSLPNEINQDEIKKWIDSYNECISSTRTNIITRDYLEEFYLQTVPSPCSRHC